MSQPLTFQQIWAVLEYGPVWNGQYGPRGEAPLTNDEKGILCGKITKDLATCHKDNGDEYFSEIWPFIKNSLAVQNWFRYDEKGYLRNHISIWRQIYNRAWRLTEAEIKKRPKPVYKAMTEAVADLFDEATKAAGEIGRAHV